MNEISELLKIISEMTEKEREELLREWEMYKSKASA